ncbi:Uncharacterised protein [Starkeya nomas]|uniref:Cysteine rich repeat protein n=2 Tax=Xanthobacteraceae TaxID=335928 RepID=A0A5S9NIF3_9HYPH|nr:MULTISPECIES: hypothetical protein [Xanthobacteraceae]TSJ61941.1 hypothetical protein FO470_10150 [Ancylobacter moscoviensis]CAA0089570.1 Uncharacterised protein [Starkeya nomas]
MFRFAFASAALLLSVMTGAASAQTMSYAEAGALIAKSCGPSIERFCAKDNLGSGDLYQCLQKRGNQVPDQCGADYQNALASIAKRVAAQRDAFRICEPSIREFCAGVQPGDARLLDCLLTASKVVAPTCKQVLLDAGWQ